MRPAHLALVLLLSLTFLEASAQDTPPAASPTDELRRRQAFTAGADARTEAALDEALRWLAAHQLEDGRWDPELWRERCWKDGRCSSPGEGERWERGNRTFTEGVTGLALLAFYGRGFTTASPLHGQVIAKGLAWLRSRRAENGSIGVDEYCGETIYNHALATAALAHAVPSMPELRGELEAAVRFCINAQNVGLGWKYGIRSGRNDSSVTAWMVYALLAAERAGVEVPEEVYIGATNWFVRATDSEGNVGYETPGGGSSVLPYVDGNFDLEEAPTMTAAAVAVQRWIGRHDPGVKMGADVVADHKPSLEPRLIHYSYWFWGAQALRQGSKAWTSWNTALKAAVLAGQRTDNCASGSWDPLDPWSSVGGRVYATAILALTLEAYYQPVAPARDFSAKAVAARAAAREAQATALAALPAQVAAIGAGSVADRHRAITALAKAINHDAAPVRDAARAQAAALSDAATATLLEDLRAGARTGVRRDVLRVLAALSTRGAPILAPIVAALTDPETSIRIAAANALGDWGPTAASAADALEKAARDPEVLLKNAADRALARVRGQ